MFAALFFVVGLLAAGALCQYVGAHRSARLYVAPGTMVDADGQRLHVVCAGAGEPAVIFESGIAASSLSWTRVMQDVAAFTHACAYDRAGLGWSDPVRRPRTIERMLAELRVVAAHGARPPYVLVGHSFGAFLVWAYAATHPTQVAGLVLLDPPSDWQEMSHEQARLLRGGIQLARLGGVLARVGVVRASLALLTGGAPGVPRNFVRVFGPTAAHTLERLVGEVRKLPPEVHPLVQAIWCQPKCFAAMAAHLGALEETAAFAAHAVTIPPVPLVVVSGGDQPDATLARHRALANLSPHGRHVVAAGSAHWIQFDAPDLVVSTIREVVEQART